MIRASLAVFTLLACAHVTAAYAQETTVPALVQQPLEPQCRGADGYTQDFEGRRTFLWRPQWLHAIAEKASTDVRFRQKLLSDGEAALRNGPYSVTEKPRLVPGATASDYTSIGPYWWPDPKKKDGLPYVRRDGEFNSERDGPAFDKDRLRRLGNDMEALALAYFVSGDERFAGHGARLLRTWFLDQSTRMAPNMNFAQGIPGRVSGRGEGIIEASDLSTVAEAAGLLWTSPALRKDDKAGLQQWYAEFAGWMATSANGEAEMRKRNNHGVFYDFFLAHFALFAGMEGVASNIVDGFPRYRLAVQMDRQGRFIEELKRTRSWHYSNFVVSGAARLATIAECLDKDLWNAALPDGRSLATAQDFLLRYSGRPATWPFPDRDRTAGNTEKMAESFAKVAMLFGRGDENTELAELP